MKTKPTDGGEHGTLATYSIGFALSIVLTLSSFWIAPTLGGLAGGSIVVAAVVQLLVQLIFFLHLGRESKFESTLGIFMLTSVILGILVVGTLWIMQNLAHLHAPAATTKDLYEHGTVAPQNELR